MKKTRAKSKSKPKSKKIKNDKTPEIIVNGHLDSITDHIKQLLLQSSQGIDLLNSKLMKRMTADYPLDKLSKNLARALLHNPCFIEKSGKWSLEKRGQERNDPIYQWLSTTGYPLNFQELKKMAVENSLEIGPEKELVWDSRFIRLKSGKWGLTSWRIMNKMTKELIEALLNCIKEKGEPVSINSLSEELNDHSITADVVEQVLEEEERLLWVSPGLVYSKELFEELLQKVSTDDPLEMFRQAEINVLQEAELMLIIKDVLPNRRQYILSSWDLEKGTLNLNRRLEKVFRDFPEVCYLNFQLNGTEKGIWYLQKQHVLAGFSEWFQENALAPGHILEISWSEGESYPNFSLSFTGEREAEVYSEGTRLQQLARLCQEAKESELDLERALVSIMDLYSSGLKYELLEIAISALGLNSQNLAQVLRAYPFFEELGQDSWRCNPAMKDTYFDFLNQIRLAQQELESSKGEAASALAEARVLQQEKESLQDELVYLQNHYREEQALYQQKISEMAMQNEHWHLENTRLKSDLAKMQQREEQLMQEMDNQSEQLLNLRQEKNKLKVKLEQLENKLVQLQGNLNRTIEDAQTEIMRLQKMAQDKNSQLESLQYANQEMQRNLARLHEERRDMKRKLSPWPVRLILSILGMINKKTAN